MKQSEQVFNRRNGGFTLIELMIVLVIVAIVLVLVPPGMAQLSLSTNLKSYSHEMLSSVYLARSEAIKRNAPATLCVSTDGGHLCRCGRLGAGLDSRCGGRYGDQEPAGYCTRLQDDRVRGRTRKPYHGLPALRCGGYLVQYHAVPAGAGGG